MSVYTVLALAIGGVVAYDFITNLIRLFSESKKLRAAGKTPLTGRNLLVVILAAIIEMVITCLITILFAWLKVPATYLNVFLMFIGTYLLRNVGSYLTAWGAWAAFVKVDSKKALEKIKADKERAIE